MALELNADQSESIAFVAGANAGYDHDNYAYAYASETLDEIPTVPVRFDNVTDGPTWLDGYWEGTRQASDDHADLSV